MAFWSTITFQGAKSTEKVEPYALFGDIDGDFRAGVDLDPGSYTLSAEAFDKDDNVLEAIDLQFEVI